MVKKNELFLWLNTQLITQQYNHPSKITCSTKGIENIFENNRS